MFFSRSTRKSSHVSTNSTKKKSSNASASDKTWINVLFSTMRSEDLYSLVLYWIFPYTGLDFVALVKQKPFSVVQERGRWITKTAFLSEPTPMVSITRCKSFHKLKNLCSKGKPHWFFAWISLTVVGLAASSFGFRVRGVLTKALALRFHLFCPVLLTVSK